MSKVNVIGIDIAKHVFHVHAVDKQGNMLFKKRLSRDEVLPQVAQYEQSLIVMEACGGAHYWGREFEKLGFAVKLIPPQFVKPYVKSNKNDWKDAEAICEAAQRPTMRFCHIKTVEQQEMQHLHRIRERMLKQRTMVSNELRGILLEYGIPLSQGHRAMQLVREVTEPHRERLSARGYQMVVGLLDDYWGLHKKVGELEKELKQFSANHPICQRLETIPGVGPIIATAIVASAPPATSFKSGRDFSAWLGLVPKQDSTGGKPRLLGISKRGDAYIRKQLIHGARSVLYGAQKKTDPLSRWAQSIKERRGWNKASVAMANKNARIIWALMYHQKEFVVMAAA
jgi:transposase